MQLGGQRAGTLRPLTRAEIARACTRLGRVGASRRRRVERRGGAGGARGDPGRRERPGRDPRGHVRTGHRGAGPQRHRPRRPDQHRVHRDARPDRRVPGLRRPAAGPHRRAAAVHDRDRGARLDAAGAAAAGARRDFARPRARSGTCTCGARRPCAPTCRTSGVRHPFRGAVRPIDVQPASWPSTARPAPASRPWPAGSPAGSAPATSTPARCTARRRSRRCARASTSPTRSRSPRSSRRAKIEISTDPEHVSVTLDGEPVDAEIRARGDHRRGERGVRRARGARAAGRRPARADRRRRHRRRGPRHRLGRLADRPAEGLPHREPGGPGAAPRRRAAAPTWPRSPPTSTAATGCDSTRAASPLTQADDAVELDTTDLDIDEVVDRLVEMVTAVGGLMYVPTVADCVRRVRPAAPPAGHGPRAGARAWRASRSTGVERVPAERAGACSPSTTALPGRPVAVRVPAPPGQRSWSRPRPSPRGSAPMLRGDRADPGRARSARIRRGAAQPAPAARRRGRRRLPGGQPRRRAGAHRAGPASATSRCAPARTVVPVACHGTDRLDQAARRGPAAVRLAFGDAGRRRPLSAAAAGAAPPACSRPTERDPRRARRSSSSTTSP